MFDFAWSEIALIGVVALIAIGPKDMPVAIRTVADMIKKARKMAGEFQTHVDEMVRDANLSEVRNQISEIRNFDIKGTIERAIDDDGSIRRTFSEDPFKTSTYTPPSTTPEPAAAITGATGVDTALADAALVDAGHGDLALAPDPATAVVSEPLAAVSIPVAEPVPQVPAAPAFIPPSIASPPVAPAFIPPGTRSSAG